MTDVNAQDPSEARGALQPPRRPFVGVALAGGAAQGAIYEIGALRALDEALVGFSLNHAGIYVGVSAGGFLSACLANQLTTAQMCRAIVKREPGEHPFVPEIFFQPALKEIGRRLAKAPGLLGTAIRSYVTRREKRLLDALTGLGRALPVGIFDNESVREYVEKIFSRPGRSDDFRQLERKLAIVTTDIESGEAAVWGTPGYDHVPISKAVQATTALPGLYPPVEIEGRCYVDGVLLKTMHASVALDAGADVVFCINPVVPVDTREAERRHELEAGHLIRQGLPSVLAQTVRTLIHSRMALGLRAYDERYPGASVVLIEPRRDDHEIFFSNIFSFSSRRTVCERAYQATRRHLRDRYDELAPLLARHGIGLNRRFLDDEERSVWVSVGLPELSENGPPRPDDAATLAELGDLLERVEALAAERAAAG
jgi:predicted acylesterase/phospholipase RssA